MVDPSLTTFHVKVNVKQWTMVTSNVIVNIVNHICDGYIDYITHTTRDFIAGSAAGNNTTKRCLSLLSLLCQRHYWHSHNGPMGYDIGMSICLVGHPFDTIKVKHITQHHFRASFVRYHSHTCGHVTHPLYDT
jgi:hypothetical protein